MRKLRRTLAVLVGIPLAALVFSAQANAGDYIAYDCGILGGYTNESVYVESPVNNPAFARDLNNEGMGCPYTDNKIDAVGTSYPGDQAMFRYDAPPGTGFLGAKFASYWDSENGVSALYMLHNAGGSGTEIIPNPMPERYPWPGSWYYVSDGQPRSVFRATLNCDRPVNPCGTGATIAIRNVELKLRDTVHPQAHVLGGSMFDPGPVSGVRTVDLGGIDHGGGVKAISLNVNSQLTHYSIYPCSDGGLTPCNSWETTTFNVNTAGPNFQNGLNRITVCVQDLANSGNTSPNATCNDRWVLR